MIGRRRASGYQLDANSIGATPNFPADPTGSVIPLTSHIRLANPRTAEAADSRILRRGPRSPEGPPAPIASRLRRANMGEGPATVRARGKKTRYYAAIAAATVLGAGVAVGTTVSGASAAPNAAGSVAVPKTSPTSTWTITPQAATPIKHL